MYNPSIHHRLEIMKSLPARSGLYITTAIRGKSVLRCGQTEAEVEVQTGKS